jgi:hypothetical protein
VLVLRNGGKPVPQAELAQAQVNFQRLTQATAQQALRLPRFASAATR